MGKRLINRTERLVEIERRLFHNPQGLRVVEIAQACRVDRRTIYRDLALLSDVGIPISQKDGRFIINLDYYMAPVRLSSHEAMALVLAARVFTHHANQYNPYMNSALKKLGNALPEPSAAHVISISEVTDTAPVDVAFVTVLETITRAWGERRKVRFWYSSDNNGSTQEHEFETYFIESTPDGIVYAVGIDSIDKRIRFFNLRRMKRVKIMPEVYEIPFGLNRKHYLAGTWGMMSMDEDKGTEVVLAFTINMTPMIKERIWHRSQRITTREDGHCVLKVNVTDWRAMLPWIRSWGSQVEVLAPRSMRDYVAREAAKVAAINGVLDSFVKQKGLSY